MATTRDGTTRRPPPLERPVLAPAALGAALAALFAALSPALAACGSTARNVDAHADADAGEDDRPAERRDPELVPDAAVDDAARLDAEGGVSPDGAAPRAYSLDLDADGAEESDASLAACPEDATKTCLAIRSEQLGDRTFFFGAWPVSSVRALGIRAIGKHFEGKLQALAVHFAEHAPPYGRTAMWIANVDAARVVAFAVASDPAAAYWNTYAGALRGPGGKLYPFLLPGAGYIRPSAGQAPPTFGCIFDPARIATPDPRCYTGFRSVDTMFAASDVQPPADASFTYRHNGGFLQDVDGDGWEDLHLPYLWVTRTLSGRTGQPLVTTTADVAAGIAPVGFHSGRQYGIFRSFVAASGRPSVLVTAGNAVGTFGDYYCGVSRYTALYDAAPSAPQTRALRWTNYSAFVKAALAPGNPNPTRAGDGVDGCIHFFGDGVYRAGTTEVAVHNRFQAAPPVATCAAEQYADLMSGNPDQTYGPCAKANLLSTRGAWRMQVQALSNGAGLTVVPNGYGWASVDRFVARGRSVLLVEPMPASVRFDGADLKTPAPLDVFELLPPDGARTWRWVRLGTFPVSGRPVLRQRDLSTGPTGSSFGGVLDPVLEDVDGDGLDEVQVRRPDGTRAWVGVAPGGGFTVKSQRPGETEARVCFAAMIPIETYRAQGGTIDTPDGRVFYAELGREHRARGSVLVLHGFPTSSWDFTSVAERLAATRHVVLFDFLGFGLSSKPEEFAYSLFEHAEVAELVAAKVGLERCHLLAHDMGTSVATELLARRERGRLRFGIDSFVLMNGSVHIELSQLTPAQQILRSPLGPLFARLNNRFTFKAQFKRVFARPPSDAELDAMWSLLAREDGASRLASTIVYIEERKRFRRRWIGALERADIPALIAWGEKDPVAILPIAKRLAAEIPGAKAVFWPDLGHYPQVEDPPRVADALTGFWDELGTASPYGRGASRAS
jgi:pimeloyl-ACP methyl ester carboxylesterase